MKLFSAAAELRMLRTLGSSKIPSSKRLVVLSSLDEDMFHTEPCRVAFQRYRAIARSKMEMLDWADILSDPAISDEFREELAEEKSTVCKNKKQIDRTHDTLAKYRKVRKLYQIAKNIGNSLEEDTVDIDGLLQDVGNDLARATKAMTDDQSVIVFGKNANSKKAVHKAITSPGEPMYKTGFHEYDQTNGGLPAVGVMLIAATTSGGKSILSTVLLKNLINLNPGLDGLRLSFEMTEEQELKRLAANLSGIPMSKFKRNEGLTDREQKRAIKAFEKWTEELDEKGQRFAVCSPDKSMNIEEALSMSAPFGYGATVIDYVGLLEGVDGDQQWQHLSNALKYCKTYATKHRTLVIALAQLDDTSDKLRYSKGMKEHVDVMWQWNYADAKVREEHILNIACSKARDGEVFGFPLEEHYHVMDVKNPEGAGASSGGRSYAPKMTDKDMEPGQEDSEDSTDRKKKKKKKKKYALS